MKFFTRQRFFGLCLAVISSTLLLISCMDSGGSDGDDEKKIESNIAVFGACKYDNGDVFDQ